jgi:hypothetical protein
MPLLGQAAMLLTFDIAAEAIVEHDDWHTHEHLPERLGIPGFLRGTRWVATQGQPRYLVLYEVAELATLESAAYLQRLNAPTPWTTKIMAHYRGMTRGFCAVTASFGLGAGQAGWLLRLRPQAGAEERLRAWLVGQLLPALPQRAGLVGAHLLEGARAPAMTNEQRLRGADAGVDWAVLVTGYEADALAALAATEFAPARLAAQGAADVQQAGYRAAVTLSADERARA